MFPAISWWIAVVCWVFLVVGCASTPTVQNTKALRLEEKSGGSAEAYSVLTVVPFEVGSNCEKAPADFGVNFSGDIVSRFRADYPDLFREVRWNESTRVPGEVILSGTIEKYRPGDAGLRFLMAGLGSAEFDGEVVLKDANDGRILFKGPFDKLWAWGGFLGGSKTIENMIAEVAVAITRTVAEWKVGNQELP